MIQPGIKNAFGENFFPYKPRHYFSLTLCDLINWSKGNSPLPTKREGDDRNNLQDYSFVLAVRGFSPTCTTQEAQGVTAHRGWQKCHLNESGKQWWQFQKPRNVIISVYYYRWKLLCLIPMATAKENYMDRKIIRELTMTQRSICIDLYRDCFEDYRITGVKEKPELKLRQS